MGNGNINYNVELHGFKRKEMGRRGVMKEFTEEAMLKLKLNEEKQLIT